MSITKNYSPNLKEIARTRLVNSELMKIPNNEHNKIEKENVCPVIIKAIKRKPVTVHDREPKDEKISNPYDIPNHMRIFSRRGTPNQAKSNHIIMSEPHTICDIDETFYKIIEGRPLRQYDDIKIYMHNIRDITLFKANTAYLKDQIIQLDTNMVDELLQYNKIFNFYLECKAHFVQFAKQSYDIAKRVQTVAEEKANKLNNMVEILESLSFEYVMLKNEISTIAAILETLSRYRDFLVQMSPEAWKNMYDKPNNRTVTCVDPDTTSSSMTSFEIYKKCIEEQLPAELFFKRSNQMIQIFDDMRKQSLNYMQIKKITNGILKSVLKSCNRLKLVVLDDISEIENVIDIYKYYIKWMEQKETEYKTTFIRIINTEFQELYASYDNNKLFTCVQYIHSHIFEEKEDIKDSVTTMILRLESLYIKLTSGLDNLDQEVVKRAKTEIFSEDIRRMRQAIQAQRTLRECNILKKSLYKSFEPPRPKHNSKN